MSESLQTSLGEVWDLLKILASRAGKWIDDILACLMQFSSFLIRIVLIRGIMLLITLSAIVGGYQCWVSSWHRCSDCQEVFRSATDKPDKLGLDRQSSALSLTLTSERNPNVGSNNASQSTAVVDAVATSADPQQPETDAKTATGTKSPPSASSTPKSAVPSSSSDSAISGATAPTNGVASPEKPTEGNGPNRLAQIDPDECCWSLVPHNYLELLSKSLRVVGVNMDAKWWDAWITRIVAVCMHFWGAAILLFVPMVLYFNREYELQYRLESLSSRSFRRWLEAVDGSRWSWLGWMRWRAFRWLIEGMFVDRPLNEVILWWREIEHRFVQGVLGLVWRILPVAALAIFVGVIHNWYELSACGLAILIGLFCLAIYLSAALYLNERFEEIANVRSEDGLREDDGLIGLPFQKAAVDQIIRRIKSSEGRNQPKVIALTGFWGSGKSFIVRMLSQKLQPWRRKSSERPTDDKLHSNDELHSIVFIHVDVWRYSSECDLHLGLFEELLAHPYVPCNRMTWWPWPRVLAYPTILVPIYLLKYFTQVLQRGNLQTSWASFSLSLPTMLWQQQMESQIDRLLDRGLRIVWCLDEIDRSSPEIAQAAITFTRRFLNQPGTFVVMPFVREQLTHKVFNPLIRTQPDIGSTMLGVLRTHAEYRSGRQPLSAGLGLRHLTVFDRESCQEPFGVQEGGSNSVRVSRSRGGNLKDFLPGRLFGGTAAGSTAEDSLALWDSEPQGGIDRYYRLRLVQHYVRLGEHDREAVDREFAEKFLDQATVELTSLSAKDAAYAVWYVNDLHVLAAQWFGLSDDSRQQQAIRRWLNSEESATMKLAIDSKARDLIPEIVRHVEAVLSKRNELHRPTLRAFVAVLQQHLQWFYRNFAPCLNPDLPAHEFIDELTAVYNKAEMSSDTMKARNAAEVRRDLGLPEQPMDDSKETAERERRVAIQKLFYIVIELSYRQAARYRLREV